MVSVGPSVAVIARLNEYFVSEESPDVFLARFRNDEVIIFVIWDCSEFVGVSGKWTSVKVTVVEGGEVFRTARLEYFCVFLSCTIMLIKSRTISPSVRLLRHICNASLFKFRD